MLLSDRRRNRSLAGAFSAGVFSGGCSTLLFQPFDVVKTRQQEKVATGLKRYCGLSIHFCLGTAHSQKNLFQFRGSMVYTFSSLLKTEGVTSLWSGLVPVHIFVFASL